HVIFVEPEKCVSIVNAMTQARDYMLAPPQKDLEPGETFTAHVRHMITRVDEIEDIQPYWNRFMEDFY
ncbi:MAG: hypothetical protein ABFS38_14740, partial [Bacteroidota bacterium]